MTEPTVDHRDSDEHLGARRTAGTVLVLCGGGLPNPMLVVPPADVVVAADSGADQAAALGLRVDVLVGDLDSIGPATLATLREEGTEVQQHPPDKDATDVELALAAAVDMAPARIVMIGGHGGRLDHALATMGALSAVATPGRAVEAWMGPALVQVTADDVSISGRPGELVSLVPIGGPVQGVTTAGLRWPLVLATLAAGSTRGVSNELVDDRARVMVGAGALAVVRPHALDPGGDHRASVPDRPLPEEPTP